MKFVSLLATTAALAYTAVSKLTLVPLNCKFGYENPQIPAIPVI